MNVRWPLKTWCVYAIVALPAVVPLAGVAVTLPSFLAPVTSVRLAAAILLPCAFIAGWGRWRAFMRHPFVVSVGAFLAVFAVAVVVAEDPARAFWGDTIRMEGMMQYVAWVGVLVASAVMLRAVRDLRTFLRVVMGAALVFGIGAVIQEVARWLLSANGTFNYRIFWPFFNPLFFGNAMALSALAAVWLSRIEEGKMRRLAVVSAALLLVMALASGSRSVILGMAGALVAVCLLRIASRKAWALRLPVSRWLVAIPVVFVVAGAALALASPGFFNRLQNVSFTERSASNRFLVWNNDLPYILERPLLGWGLESHLIVFYRWFTADFYSRTPEVFDRAHSVVVETAVNTGFFGLAAGLAMLAATFWTVRRRIIGDAANRQAWLVAGAIFGYAVASDLVGFQTVYSLAILVPLVGAVLGADGPPEPTEQKRPPYAATAAVIAICAAYATFAVILPLRAGILAVRAYDRYSRDLPGSMADFAAATAVPTFMDDHFGKFFAYSVQQEILTLQVRDEAQVLAAGRLAETALLRAEAAHPWDPSLPLARAMLYEQLGKLDPTFQEKTAPTLEKLVARYPERFEGRQLLALAYLRLGRNDDALAQYAFMLSRNPRIPTLQQLYAIALYRAGRTQDALAALDEALRLSPSSEERIVRIRERMLAGESLEPALAGSAPVATDMDGQGVVEP